jgi:hypothetical protein
MLSAYMHFSAISLSFFLQFYLHIPRFLDGLKSGIGSGGIGGGGAGVFRLAFTLARSSAGIGFLAAFLASDIAFFSA